MHEAAHEASQSLTHSDRQGRGNRGGWLLCPSGHPMLGNVSVYLIDMTVDTISPLHHFTSVVSPLRPSCHRCLGTRSGLGHTRPPVLLRSPVAAHPLPHPPIARRRHKTTQAYQTRQCQHQWHRHTHSLHRPEIRSCQCGHPLHDIYPSPSHTAAWQMVECGYLWSHWRLGLVLEPFVAHLCPQADVRVFT